MNDPASQHPSRPLPSGNAFNVMNFSPQIVRSKEVAPLNMSVMLVTFAIAHLEMSELNFFASKNILPIVVTFATFCIFTFKQKFTLSIVEKMLHVEE